MQLAHWKPDCASQQCDSCAKKFEFFRRRHHCRLCGGIFCYSCSNAFLPGDLILLRWLDVNGHRAAAAKTAAVDATVSDKRLETMMERHFPTSPYPGGFSLPPTTTTLQRVCARCFDDVEVHAGLHTGTRSRGAHGGAFAEAGRGGNSAVHLRSPGDRRESLVGGRERKVCVILLQGSGVVESGERTDPRELFHALGQLTIQAKSHSSQGNPSSKETTPSLGPSLSSASDLSGSEKNLFGTSVGGRTPTATPRTGQQSFCRRFSATSTPTKYRKKIVLQVPLPLNTSDPTRLSPASAVPNLSVRIQLVGITHRHGFDKALLQQHTIGTDAYVILLDGEPGSPLDTPKIPGVCSGFGNGTTLSCPTPHSGNTILAPTISIFPHSLETTQAPPPEAMPPTIGAAYDRSFSGNLMESARAVWEAIGRYGGDTPICAVIDCASCTSPGSPELAAAPAPSGCSSTSQTGGGVNPRCHNDRHQRSVPVEVQAAALHRALLLLTDEVLRRDIMRRKG
ncbi:zinc finger protein [Trypanosoma conorhini]|uniref:Zinc finger protein n=1 Tax=Trypanosoma conorhini TaxID=83891 RepID=A0A422MPQ4_9TRYP|nr:zinc finger protein [Trypanosoma conorhini]RNE95184.1 zinc finger protein [Trypanosoma conorhini]